MKYIKRLKPIFLHNKDGSIVASVEALSHEDYVDQYYINDKRFGASAGCKGVLAGGKVQVAFQGTASVISLEDSDYELLIAAIETPDPFPGSGMMSPEMARQYAPFMRAIMDATDKPPKKEKAPKAKKKPKSKKGKSTKVTPPGSDDSEASAEGMAN